MIRVTSHHYRSSVVLAGKLSPAIDEPIKHARVRAAVASSDIVAKRARTPSPAGPAASRATAQRSGVHLSLTEGAPAAAKFLVHLDETGRVKIDVRLDGETVGLTQGQPAELFDTTQQNISLHVQHIYEQGELEPEATHKDYLTVRREGPATWSGHSPTTIST